jgi:hypothetical protein
MQRTMRVLSLVLLTGLLSVPAAQAVLESRPPAPYPTYVWRPGYHRWVGSRFVWAPGTWARPPYRGGIWVPGRWDHEHRGYFWRSGHWARR